mmetsp:Transcript_22659/g.37443  ORF Transcript_22659/g.37443 Transcript_22659/m.37443 type:complete len:102 (-) Transcript_22659:114-419(-)
MREPPPSWEFYEFQDPAHIRRFLNKDHGDGRAHTETIAHRPNRLVLFKSTLFHESVVGGGAFREGHTNRRLSFTFLFGQRGSECQSRLDGTAKAAAERDEL